jgi:hypothetical protein
VRRAAVLLVVFLAGCGFGGDERTIDTVRVDELVLHPADVGAAFGRTSIRRLADRPSAEARFRPVRAADPVDPLMIVSRAEVFPSSDAAKRWLDASRSALAERWQPISEPGLGDESFAATLVDGVLRYFRVSWRADNATADLRVDGFDAKLALGDVLELALKQQRRIAEAAG